MYENLTDKKQKTSLIVVRSSTVTENSALWLLT